MSQVATSEPQNTLPVTPSPKIVRVWFDTVLNPILTGLRVQQEYLAKANWTWRYRGSQFEVIAPAVSYIDIRFRDNYEHLIAYETSIQDRLIEHGKQVEQLRKACKKLQSTLQQNQKLHELYKRYTSPEVLEKLGTTTDKMFGGYSIEDHIAYLAQLIINSTDELPDYYTAHPIWNRYREEFIGILNEPENRHIEEAISIAVEELKSMNLMLISEINRLRLQLSNEFGEPFISVEAGRE
jgi:hypothetical protein